jgi:SET domain-containing protein
VSLRAREVVPTADFAPPPYETLRRSIYLHDQPRETLSADDVTVCSCTLASGGCDHRCANRAMQSECSNASCRLGPSCGNRPFANLGATSQRPLQLFKTDGKGWGVMSTRNIEQGELVVEYVGEVIDHDTWESRKAKLWRFDHMYFMTLNRTEIVDATERGNIARFINHSCDPNLQVEKWYVNRTPRLGLWAKRPIVAGEELSYNYSVKWHGDPDVAQRCYCGAYNCTGYLGLPPKR